MRLGNEWLIFLVLEFYRNHVSDHTSCIFNLASILRHMAKNREI